MCGIAGVWGSFDEQAVLEMMRRMAHRGPDASGTHRGENGWLGHRRLSIMDPTGGDQPIVAADRKRAIIANGEIYNFPLLRTRLAGNHTFRTRSDSESALHLYEEMGAFTAERLDGMFAFAIADGPDLYAARDAIGIKPLYYGRRGNGRVFASELKALAGLAADVREFPPGTCYHSRTGFRTFYEVPHLEPAELPVEQHLRRLRETLERAVEKRLMSDVPVGAFLSGGLDSSVIAAMVAGRVDELHTFSVGLEGSRDIAAARVVARHIDSIHHEHIFTMDEVLDRLPEIVFFLESYDQDLVRSAIPCYFTSRLAARHLKVILTGEGADELFAGYRYYPGIEREDWLHDELRRSVCSLHNINLQRVDRLTMAHGLEGRVPFLDTEMIEIAQTIPARYKLYRQGGERPVEKWILRKACEDLLPREIVWRDKEQFDEGTGTAGAIAGALDRFLPAKETERYLTAHPDASLRGHEECVYHKLLCEAYSQPETILSNVARWSDRPDDLWH
jgi:asparagine synthase (glutamine-hydrolysing)